jgi:glycosyltransferase involved in cell wall biosynthesis
MPDFNQAPGGGGAAPAVGRIPVTAQPPAAESSPKAARPIRLVLVLYRDDLNLGGSLRVVEILANALDPARVEAHIVFAYGGPGPIASRATVPCHFLNAKGPIDIRSWWRARSVISSINPDIVHFHNPAYWLHAALIGKKHKKLFHLHGPFFPKKMSFFQRWLMARSSRLADATVCITRSMRQMVLQLGWGEPDRTWTVYNGIDCAAPATAPSKREARFSLGLPYDGMVIGVVCRLAWYKGCRDAIRVLERLHPQWRLLFCGDGPMKEYLIEQAKQAGVADRTHFAGVLTDMRAAYASMDAFLFLSKLEPFGLVIAEAMAARVPVFGLAAEGAYRDSLYPLITSDNSVFIERSSPGDYISPEPAALIDELARHINEYGLNPESHRDTVDRAQRWVFERFDARVQAEAMLEIYDFVLGCPSDVPK